MRADQIIATLANRNIVLSIDGGKLLSDAPKGELTDGDRAIIRQHKAELVAHLAHRPTWFSGYRPARGLIGCDFPPRQTKTPPDAILDTRVRCRCGRYFVQPELRSINGGVCWDCHEGQ